MEDLTCVLVVLITSSVAGDWLAGLVVGKRHWPFVRWLGAAGGATVGWWLVNCVNPAAIYLDPNFWLRLPAVGGFVGGVVELPLLISRGVKSGQPTRRTAWQAALVAVAAGSLLYLSTRLPSKPPVLFDPSVEPIVTDQ